jgi:iron complex outermembrane receptor protein
VTVIALLAILSPPAKGQERGRGQELSSLSIEELMNIKVTSASKTSENLSVAPAAIFVITSEDIRRGGFSSIPDALRMVPGLHVAQQSAHVWIVAARGFSSLFNRQMLVPIDGRLVYTPTFGGVWWDVQNPPLEDIDRIEIIRGPGGALWGANAVNGVINITTKDANQTLGALVATSAGINEGYAARFRYGGKLGDKFAYRVYATRNDWLPTADSSGGDSYDQWTISQGGTRLDWNLSQKDRLLFEGAGYSGRTRDVIDVFSPTAPPGEIGSNGLIRGGHALGQWNHSFNEHSSTDVLAYCDWTSRDTEGFIEQRTTCDLEFQHNYSFTPRHNLIWGGQVTTTFATQQADFRATYIPVKDRDTVNTWFLQYEVELLPKRLRVIAGSKFELNTETRFEYQPQIRAVWTPRREHTAWIAISRVVRTPTTVEHSLRARVAQLSLSPPTFLQFNGSEDVDSEVEHAFEAGYRYQRKDRFTLDAAAYYNDFYGLVGRVRGTPIVHTSPSYIDVPLTFANIGPGHTHGLEIYTKYIPIRRWNLSAGFTMLRGNSVAGLTNPAPALNDPREQVNVQSSFNLMPHVSLRAAYYYYDAIPNALPPVHRVDAGITVDRFRGFSFSIWGRNLEAQQHQEVQRFILPAGEIRRSLVFKLMWESQPDQNKAAN